jgi:hypothetical protein
VDNFLVIGRFWVVGWENSWELGVIAEDSNERVLVAI